MEKVRTEIQKTTERYRNSNFYQVSVDLENSIMPYSRNPTSLMMNIIHILFISQTAGLLQALLALLGYIIHISICTIGVMLILVSILIALSYYNNERYVYSRIKYVYYYLKIIGAIFIGRWYYNF